MPLSLVSTYPQISIASDKEDTSERKKKKFFSLTGEARSHGDRMMRWVRDRMAP